MSVGSVTAYRLVSYLRHGSLETQASSSIRPRHLEPRQDHHNSWLRRRRLRRQRDLQAVLIVRRVRLSLLLRLQRHARRWRRLGGREGGSGCRGVGGRYG